MINRNDMELIAKALKESRIEGHGLNSASTKYINEQWESCVERIAHMLSVTNSRFKHDLFIRACHGG